MINFTEKITICYTCCGPTYRKSALEKLTNYYSNHPNLYYCVITDDRTYFKDLKKENLIVNELKDFYPEFPYLEKYEPFLESTDAEDYGKKFLAINYKFPFATMRFHLIQAKDFGVSNVALLGTDSTVNLDFLTDELLSAKNILYNYVSMWTENITTPKIKMVTDMIKERYNLINDSTFVVFDEATRLYIFKDVNFMETFFYMWNDIVTTLYREDKMKHYTGSYAMHDEFLLAAIYNVIGITRPPIDGLNHRIFNVNHNQKEERFWAC